MHKIEHLRIHFNLRYLFIRLIVSKLKYIYVNIRVYAILINNYNFEKKKNLLWIKEFRVNYLIN